VEALLLFACVYAFWRWLGRKRISLPKSTSTPPTTRAVVLYILALTAATFLIRIWLPIGWVFQPLDLQFPFFAQYMSLFAVGIIASRRNWFLSLPAAMGRL
jgi:glucans biosynthesis protein C